MSTQQQVLSAFKEHFSTTPKLFYSPGRINLIGEHIDYNDGFVMPAAIDKGVWFAVAANNTNKVNFVSVDLNDSYSTETDKIEKNESWKNYVLGVLHVLQVNKISFGGFDCAFGGNLPVGAGLSSSAAVEGGLLFALNTIFSFGMNRIEMALLAQKAEHGYPGVNCGIMDQFASLNGQKDHVILLDCTSLEHKHFPLQLEKYNIVLINTKVHHSLASGEYNKRRKNCEDGFKLLKTKLPEAKSFRSISSQQVAEQKSLLDAKTFDRCLYVTQEIERTQLAGKLLEENNLAEFGKLMFQTHEGLSKLYEVSCDELDFLVDEAKKHSSIIGARLMGGGFGGCTINIIEKEKTDATFNEITAAYFKKFNVHPEVYITNTSNGTYEIV
ncbi:MAG: galactokinase [Bacteroidota bacterium]|nr:galactokinase [Bacteroidota bacterium]